jgi:glycerol uptake facilitator-like aquaporin
MSSLQPTIRRGQSTGNSARSIRAEYAHPLSCRLAGEGLGSLLLAATVVGSGIMAERLSGDNGAVALLANTGATVAVLATLIALFGPLSGAHFNPAVSVIESLRGRLAWRDAAQYMIAQIIGCCCGALLAHVMFELPVWQTSVHIRTGPAQWLAEAVATFGLLLVVLGHRRSEDAPWMVAAWIGAAYWFTASTSFANPAITIARSLTDTFAGIRPADVPGFIAAQFLGALAALAMARVLFPVKNGTAPVSDIQGIDEQARKKAEAHDA